MSVTVLALAKSFVMERLSAEEFSNAYMEIWKFERDSEILLKDDAKLSECLSSIFCLADLYNPESDRDEYELDEEQLRQKVSSLIANFTSHG
ncbi:colicin immunity domain-containing protein [Methylobacter sp.]|uniref:colicin immunity domain-containing protein n=1 Tax=Methylobacter sp. TaxID=2051955 RepID=UPI00121F97E3|nr:colicin immunity domain-containing protein [Methylobacter sp.]TAK59873.1 MAG: colicin immunity protein [Methylobacter sp.]